MREAGAAATVTVALVIAAPLVSPAVADDEPAEPAPPPVAERRLVGDGEHRTGLVVDDGEEVRTVCIRFEEEITGEDLLERSGLNLELAYFGTLGAAVCAIGDVGCPAEDCHCEPSYWSYWINEPEADDGWASSSVGATSREIRDGDLDAHVWGDGRRRPPAIDLDTVCDLDGADVTGGPPAADHPDAPPEAVDTTGPGDTLADLAWFALAIGLVATAIWWRRRRPGGGG